MCLLIFTADHYLIQNLTFLSWVNEVNYAASIRLRMYE